MSTWCNYVAQECVEKIQQIQHVFLQIQLRVAGKCLYPWTRRITN